MSNCKICFDKSGGKIMRRPTDDLSSSGCSCNTATDPCVCPPIGEPDHLTIVAPVVFDECGINLCKVARIPGGVRDDCESLVESIRLEVIDIDFNITSMEGSSVEFIPHRPNCVRVRLSNICVKFAAQLFDSCGRIIRTLCFSTRYLPPDVEDPDYDPETNPTSVTIELYAPYGVSYLECGGCIPAINFLGFVQNDMIDNNSLRQGIDVHALAKVLKFDPEEDLAAIGLTLYIKSVYFVQYRIKHAGLSVPPKCVPIEEVDDNACIDFVEGELLEQNIRPLTISRPRTPSNDNNNCGPTPTGNLSSNGNVETNSCGSHTEGKRKFR